MPSDADRLALPHGRELVTRLPHAESELRGLVYEAIGRASVCWEDMSGAGVFNDVQATKIGRELMTEILRLTNMNEPSLGLAATRDLLDELGTRIRLGHIEDDYSTL